jgi:hypothetical protein
MPVKEWQFSFVMKQTRFKSLLFLCDPTAVFTLDRAGAIDVAVLQQ